MTTNYTVDKEKLLATLEANRSDHVTEFEAAQDRYRERVIEAMDKNLADAKAGRKIHTYIRLPVPEDHTDDYDWAIEGLQWEVGETVELSRQDFNRLVRNKWEWHESYVSNTQAYTVGALS